MLLGRLIRELSSAISIDVFGIFLHFKDFSNCPRHCLSLFLLTVWKASFNFFTEERSYLGLSQSQSKHSLISGVLES